MADKIFGVDFTNETNPTAGMTISVHNGTALRDVELQYLYKAFGSAATQALLDLLSTTQGTILYFNGTDWVALSPGTSGQVLKTAGAGANPSWGHPTNLTITSQAQGDILYYNGTSWVRLAAGTSGQYLKTLGAGANPAWDSVSSSGGGSNSIMDGRLTLASGVPIPTTDQSAKTTVYLTPYLGNKIALYDGSAWNVRTLTEISVAVPATTNTPFDVFCYDNAGTPTLEATSWTNDTTRATALTRQDGVLVKSGAATRRYIGTCRTTGSSGNTEDSVTKRFVWNFYNRVNKRMYVRDTNLHTYNGATRKWNNSDTNNKLEFIVGQYQSVGLNLAAGIKAGADASYAIVTFYLDGAAIDGGYFAMANLNVQNINVGGGNEVEVAEGYRYTQVYEAGNHASSTFEWMWMNARILC